MKYNHIPTPDEFGLHDRCLVYMTKHFGHSEMNYVLRRANRDRYGELQTDVLFKYVLMHKCGININYEPVS